MCFSAIIAATVTLLAAPVAATGEHPLLKLVRALRDNGTLAPAVYRELVDAIAARHAVREPAASGDATTDVGRRVQVTSGDGAFSARIGGRVQADYDGFDRDQAALGSGTEIRRARLFMTGTLSRQWRY